MWEYLCPASPPELCRSELCLVLIATGEYIAREVVGKVGSWRDERLEE